MPRGPKGEKRPADVIGAAVHVMRIATGEVEDAGREAGKEYARRGGLKGGKSRAKALSPAQRKEIAKKAELDLGHMGLCAHLITGYGSTETGRCACAHRIAHIPRAVGYVAPGARVEVVDEADRPLPAGGEGLIRIASEYGIDRYIDDPVESAKVFRGGWFYPGDFGAITTDNVLIINGRTNDVLNAGGGKIAAENVEAALMAFPGVDEAAVFMATSKRGVEEVWAGIVCGGKVEAERLRMHCQSRLPDVFVPAHIIVLDALPLGPTGKVDRPRLKQMLLQTASA